VVEVLLEHGANVNDVMTFRKEKTVDEDSGSEDSYDSDDEDDDDGNKETPLPEETTPLHAVIARKHQDLALLLLNNGADAGVTNERGETPLLQASKFGLVSVVERLLKMGVHVNVSSGETPMDVACQGGHTDVVRLLLPFSLFSRIDDSSD
jgi:ankyrin repeat protein